MPEATHRSGRGRGGSRTFPAWIASAFGSFQSFPFRFPSSARAALWAACTALVAVVGPHLGHGARAAGAPLAFEPVTQLDAPFVRRDAPDGGLVWQRSNPDHSADVIALTISGEPYVADARTLAQLEREMPVVFEATGGSWRERSAQVHQRPDGVPVLVIVGEVTGDRPSQTEQVVLPTDRGSAIVTASYAAANAPREEGELAAAIDRAQGVALRRAAASAIDYLGWAAGSGAVFAMALFRRARRR